MKYFWLILCPAIALIFIACGSANSFKNDTSEAFEIYSSDTKAVILYEKGKALDSITANLLSEDIYKVTNYRPKVVTEINSANGKAIVIGSLDSPLINTFLKGESLNEGFKTQWESYHYKTIANPTKHIQKAFVIAGTNPRGTAYGVFNISKQIGVSPWYWWADVPVKKKDELILNQSDLYSKTPSVKYRGIFLNDEDWGLQPWAEHNFEPETGDIGPKTYSKIFELLLRLNANTIWPAMHPSTKAFFHYPGNVKMAELYNIVIGTSHAEPMLRNNVDEWDKGTMGSFNYKTNKDEVFKYWEDRVKEAKNVDAIYTMGMRGVHDSGMEGVKSKDEAVALLDGIIKDQRSMLKKHINTDATQIPQAFTVYKEVLDLYKNGLKVPDDVTLVWTDDNYGYIRALSNPEEQKRSGGGGVYYHASYWGRPHDYLWLSSTNPVLIREEMMKAYNLNNKNIWILNVGDIKPLEYNMQLFLDMAYNTEPFQNPEYVAEHQEAFFTDIFGNSNGKTISEIKTEYYQLAFERRPEFMGWSQTEPTTPIYKSGYNAFSNGDEIQKRIEAFNKIEEEVNTIENNLPNNLISTFTQLVSYPVKGAAHMNRKFLYRDKALAYVEQGRKSASKYKVLAHESYKTIEKLTEAYTTLSNGKWKGMMDMKPRRLPVFNNPEIDLLAKASDGKIGVSIEDTLKVVDGTLRIPVFYVGNADNYFVDVFLKNNNETATWEFQQIPNWLKLSQTSGVLNDSELETRIQVSVDWKAWEQEGKPVLETIQIKSGTSVISIQIKISNSYETILEGSFIEKNGMVVAYVEHFTDKNNSITTQWKRVNLLGHSKSVMEASPLSSKPILDHKTAPILQYEFFTETLTDYAIVNLVALPTHPTTTDGRLRIALQWNDESIQVLDFKTEGRSREWKQNVLSNKAQKQIRVPINSKGKQTLKLFMVDPAVLLDYIVLDTSGKANLPYQLIPETIKK
ncbi:glycosyl hydrolase 115 family protein [Flavisericum labens]|uniref:glycosyl hydrolase 115 family protein n=1 Tax=Flavisericum labens TaxID=3377112 RepID=UPI00387A8979